MALSNQTFVLLLALGGALLALWLHVRVPRLEPQRWQIVLVHLTLGMLVLNVVVPAEMKAVLVHETPVAAVAAAIGIALPGFTYALLGCVWLVRIAQRALAGGMR